MTTPALPEPLALSPIDVAAQLRISRMQVYRLLDAGLLTSFKIGRLRRIPVASVEDYVASQAAAK